MTEHPYLQSRIVRIFRTRSYLEAYDDEGSVYQGCLRPSGKPLRVAVDLDDGEYPPEVVLQGLAVSGAYVGALSVVGEASQAECKRYTTANPPVCPTPTADVHVVDMRRRQAVDVGEPDGTAGLVLSSVDVGFSAGHRPSRSQRRAPATAQPARSDNTKPMPRVTGPPAPSDPFHHPYRGW